MHLGTKFYFSSNCPKCSGVEETSKCISSFPQWWETERRQTERKNSMTLNEKEKKNRSHIVFRNGWGRPYFFCSSTSFLFRATSLSCASPTTALGKCYDNWKWWTARARSGMNRSQGGWHAGVGERDNCWESCSLEIQPSSELPAGIHEEVCADSNWCAEWSKQAAMTGKRDGVKAH